jgi:hypothetical protein
MKVKCYQADVYSPESFTHLPSHSLIIAPIHPSSVLFTLHTHSCNVTFLFLLTRAGKNEKGIDSNFEKHQSDLVGLFFEKADSFVCSHGRN